MLIRPLAISLLLLAFAAVSVPLSAQQQTTIGFVDVQKVFQDYEKTASSNKTLEALGKKLDAQLQSLSQHKLLSETERAQLLQLVGKDTLTDKEKESLKALDDRQKALEQELQTLQQKNPPTDQEKARLKELMDTSSKTDEQLAKLSDEFENQFNAKKDELSKAIRDDILAAIETVAKEKKIGVVIDKIAVLYGGTDITQPVIDKLNKKK